jgi:hypothetical protein
VFLRFEVNGWGISTWGILNRRIPWPFTKVKDRGIPACEIPSTGNPPGRSQSLELAWKKLKKALSRGELLGYAYNVSFISSSPRFWSRVNNVYFVYSSPCRIEWIRTNWRKNKSFVRKRTFICFVMASCMWICQRFHRRYYVDFFTAIFDFVWCPKAKRVACSFLGA